MRFLNMNKITKLKKVYFEILKKPIFMCSDQTVKHKKKRYILPKCRYVQIDCKDWSELHDAIMRLDVKEDKEAKQ